MLIEENDGNQLISTKLSLRFSRIENTILAFNYVSSFNITSNSFAVKCNCFTLSKSKLLTHCVLNLII